MKFFLIFILLLVFVSCATFKDEDITVKEAVEVNNHEGKFAYLVGGEVVRTDKVYRVGDTLK